MIEALFGDEPQPSGDWRGTCHRVAQAKLYSVVMLPGRGVIATWRAALADSDTPPLGWSGWYSPPGVWIRVTLEHCCV